MSDSKRLQCLLITPFSGEFPSIRRFIAESLREIGVEPILLEETAKTGVTIVEAVQQAIERADFVIADLTGNNPNVMYELGFAHALRKPVLLMVQDGAGPILSDISGYIYLVYKPTHPDKLRLQLQRWVSSYLGEGKRRHGDE